MSREIILPPHLYDRIKASAGEHGGIGRAMLFSKVTTGTPHCVHGHAWGTCTRYAQSPTGRSGQMSEPELRRYISHEKNDDALRDHTPTINSRVSFDQWCELLNVKRGVAPVVDCEPAVEFSVAVQ